MTFRSAGVLFGVAIMTVVAAGQSSVLPTLTGFVYDAGSRSVRPILGIPGSAYLGPAVIGDVEAAWLSPAPSAAIVIRDGGTRLLTHLGTLRPEEQEGTLLAAPSLVAWDAEGSIAALYSAATGDLQRVRISVAGVSIDAVEAAGSIGTVHALAVNAKGEIAVSSADGIYRLQPGASATRLSEVPAVALSFGSGDTLYAAGDSSVTEIRTRSGASRALVPGRRLTSLAASLKSGVVWGVEDGTRAVAFDLAGAVVAEVRLDRAATSFVPLNGRTFLLNPADRDGQPLLVLNTAGDPAVFFIPTREQGSL